MYWKLILVLSLQIAEQKLDPRSASRTPSAAKEPHYKTRYDSPVYACTNTVLLFLNRYEYSIFDFMNQMK